MASAAAAAAPMIKQHQAALRKLSETLNAETLKKADTARQLAQQNGLPFNQQGTAQQGVDQQPTAGGQPNQLQPPKKSTRKLPKPPERAQRALFCLDLKNPIRKRCIAIVEYQYPFHKIHITMSDLFFFF